MNADNILNSLKQFTDRERIEFLPLAPDSKPVSEYLPIHKYALDLKNGAKPETAAEDLFTALCKDILRIQPTRQVGSGDGWVDFILPERKGEPLPLELKPLFQRDGPDAIWRNDANPKQHVTQVKKYLAEHEYLILTDLRTAWFYSARDFFFEDKAFAELPFADFFARCRDSRSILDTLRRLEDAAEKPELEKQFFEDLKIWFNEFEKVKWTPQEQAAESIILLINKLIFARTIEDFGLVQYRFTQDEYARFTRLWEPKGAHRVVPKFLDFFEDFFDEYYDTEIFSARVWDRLDKDPANLERFCKKLDFVLGINTWDQVFSRGIVHYNYRRIDEDIFGKSYEMFLAANRKDEGIYYTPAGITGPMADSLVASLTGKLVDEICDAVGSQKCDFARAEKLMADLAEIRVADTACGSGGFLIKVLRAFWQQYQRIDQACGWIQKILKPENGEMFLAELPPNVEAALGFRRRQNLENRRVLIAQILLRHIFGVDKDPGALEVAKTNIWKEAVKLSPADYNYRELKMDVVKILPNLELNFHCADSLVDVETEKQTQWLAEYHQAELKKLSELRARYIENPMRHESLDDALALRAKVHADLVEHFQTEKFRSPRDYELGKKIRGDHALLGGLGYQFRRELHLTGDARFLHKIGSKKLQNGEMPLLEGKTIFQFDAQFSPPSWFVVESEVRPELLRKEVFRIADFVRDTEAKEFEGKPLPKSRDDLEKRIREVFEKRKFRLHYEFRRLAYREVGSSTNERTLIASILPNRACFSHKLMYLTPCRYTLGTKGKLEQAELPSIDPEALLPLMNSLTLNFYVRSKVSTGVSVHHLYELPIAKLPAAQKKKLGEFATKLLEDPHDVKERAALEVFIARELYGLSLDDWKHLTGTFTFGSGATKEELDEIIRQSLVLWES